MPTKKGAIAEKCGVVLSIVVANLGCGADIACVHDEMIQRVIKE